MKKLVLMAFASLLYLSIYADEAFPIDSISKKVLYSEIVPNRVSKTELFSNAKEWISTQLTVVRTDYKLSDSESGKIIVTGSSPITNFESYGYKCHYVYTITIECKEGRYRYTITDINYYFISGYIPFESEVNAYDKFMTTLNELLIKDTSTLNKLELKKHNENLSKYINSKSKNETSRELSKNNFLKLIESLKLAMSKTSNF